MFARFFSAPSPAKNGKSEPERCAPELPREMAERKRNEEALAEAECLLFRSLMNGSPDSIYFKDTHSRFIYANQALAYRCGQANPAALLGKTDFDFFTDEHARAAYEDEQKIIRTGDPLVNIEEKETWSDRPETWVSTTKLPLRDKDGRIIGTFGISRDITERKLAEERIHKQAVAEAEHLFRSLMGGIPDAIYFKDTHSRFIRANQAIAKRFGQASPAALLGKTDFDFFTHEHARIAYEQEQLIIRTGVPLVEIEEKETWSDRPDTWVATTKLPLRDQDGRIIGIFGISRDITERKLAEERIRDHAKLLDLVGDAIVVRDMEERVMFWNKASERMYGWTAQEVMGEKNKEFLHTDVFKYGKARVTVLEKGSWSGEFEAETKEGRELIVEARWTLVRDAEGKPKSILGISTDITKKKQLETQTLRSQRLESLGILAGGIAHDLNNVLTPVLVAIELLKGNSVKSEDQKLLDALEANVQRGAKLIKQVLAFGRGVKGERVPVQLGVVVHEIKQIVHETFPKSLEFETGVPADLWNVIGDATQLYQVLLNLCVNGRDAMPDGGKLSIHMENIRLDEAYAGMNLEAKPGSYVMISVADTGTGIPKAVQDKMFEPFFTTKEFGKGTGLGLSTCRGIVKSHGGFISCYSEVGRGSVFKVYLPADITPAAEEHLAQKSPRLPCGHNELVLVADDEQTIREIAEKALARFGYRVLTATNGAEAVSAYQRYQDEIAAVVIDMEMPVMNGRAAIAALKAINPHVTIISASGLDTANGTTNENGRGRCHFLPKPFTADVLLQTLQRALSHDSGPQKCGNNSTNRQAP